MFFCLLRSTDLKLVGVQCILYALLAVHLVVRAFSEGEESEGYRVALTTKRKGDIFKAFTVVE